MASNPCLHASLGVMFVSAALPYSTTAACSERPIEGVGVRLSAPAEVSQVIERDSASFKTAASKAGIEPKS
jgi:hypothetical protein